MEKRKSLLPPEILWQDPQASARVGGLRYVHDGQPGIRRRPCGRGFVYFGPDGQMIRDRQTLKRLRNLVIPPAWQKVWICCSPHGHLQATGRDARGRKQYLYHAAWGELRNEVKFAHILQFAEALPAMRQQVARDLRKHDLPREKMLAVVVRLLEKSLIRVGNEEYLRQNLSFGLTTMRRDHVEIEGSNICFSFRGKSGQWHERCVSDHRVSRVLRQILELPGQELFRYRDQRGELHAIASEDVNGYLREATGADLTTKDIRTWHATVAAASVLQELGPWRSPAEGKRKVGQAVRQVARLLGNRPATSRKYYIHPEILESYLHGQLLSSLQAHYPRQDDAPPAELAPMEEAVRSFLADRQQGGASKEEQ
jgi:DNA topoisomerase I